MNAASADEVAEAKAEDTPSVISLGGSVAEEENVSEADTAEEEAVKAESQAKTEE